MELSISRPNPVGAAEAKKRIHALLAQVLFLGKVDTGIWSWDGYVAAVSFRLYGLSFVGKLNVTETTVDVTAPLPIIAVPFRSRINKEISSAIDNALSGVPVFETKGVFQ